MGYFVERLPIKFELPNPSIKLLHFSAWDNMASGCYPVHIVYDVRHASSRFKDSVAVDGHCWMIMDSAQRYLLWLCKDSLFFVARGHSQYSEIIEVRELCLNGRISHHSFYSYEVASSPIKYSSFCVYACLVTIFSCVVTLERSALAFQRFGLQELFRWWSLRYFC